MKADVKTAAFCACVQRTREYLGFCRGVSAVGTRPRAALPVRTLPVGIFLRRLVVWTLDDDCRTPVKKMTKQL